MSPHTTLYDLVSKRILHRGMYNTVHTSTYEIHNPSTPQRTITTYFLYSIILSFYHDMHMHR